MILKVFDHRQISVFPNASFAKLNKIETPELPRYYFKTIRKAVGQAIIYNDLIFCDLEEVRNGF